MSCRWMPTGTPSAAIRVTTGPISVGTAVPMVSATPSADTPASTAAAATSATAPGSTGPSNGQPKAVARVSSTSAPCARASSITRRSPANPSATDWPAFSR